MKTKILALAALSALVLGVCSSAPSEEPTADTADEDLTRRGGGDKLQIFHYPCDIYPGGASCWSILGWEHDVSTRPYVRLKQGNGTVACVPSNRPGVKVANLTTQRQTFTLQGVSRCDAPDTGAEALGRMTINGTPVVTKGITCNDCDKKCSGRRGGWLNCWGDHFDEDDDEQAANPNPCPDDQGELDYAICVGQCNAANNSHHGCAGSGAAPSSGAEDCSKLVGLEYMICRIMSF